jgi:nucleotide-binding universal stress UspA family protein
MAPSMVEQIMKDTQTKSLATAKATRAAFDQMCKAAGARYAEKPMRTNAVTVAWREEIGYEDQSLRTWGRLNDLTVLPRSLDGSDVGVRLSLEAALMDTGRPLLVVPPQAPAKIGSNVAIAWNGSVEASRAVNAAKPFLLAARKVSILTAKEPSNEDIGPESLRAALAWHGISAKVEPVRARGDIAKALLSAADRAGANLLVMGAYTHSRVREMILGGVTRHVLSEAEIPTLLAH